VCVCVFGGRGALSDKKSIVNAILAALIQVCVCVKGKSLVCLGGGGGLVSCL
jgi:hypothetical protein